MRAGVWRLVVMWCAVVRCGVRHRVGIGVSASGGMINSLVAIAVPGSNTVQFYRTNDTARRTPTVVRWTVACVGCVGSVGCVGCVGCVLCRGCVQCECGAPVGWVTLVYVAR